MVALLAAAALCTPADGKALVRRFAAAWNRGDVAAATALWATKPEFMWLSGPKRSGAKAYDRSTLRAYIRSRPVPLRIVTLRAGYDGARNLVHFSGMLRTGPFKGAITCSTRTPLLIVWSMG